VDSHGLVTPFARDDAHGAKHLADHGLVEAPCLPNLLVAPVAISVNLVASIPGAVVALFQGRLHSRVPATILLAVGGFVPSVTSGLSRFGITETFFLGELLGVVFLFAGFLVSIEVFREIRIPFTHRVLHVRHEAA
jgi:hypothetical protein